MKCRVIQILTVKKWNPWQIRPWRARTFWQTYRTEQALSALKKLLPHSAKVMRGSDELIRLGKGEFFGELSVIDQQPRNASVEAAEPTKVLALASWDLLALLESDPQLALNLIKGLVVRVRLAVDELAGAQLGH